eukprot:10031044-Alexandrium_andersonii.AAC.1
MQCVVSCVDKPVAKQCHGLGNRLDLRPRRCNMKCKSSAGQNQRVAQDSPRHVGQQARRQSAEATSTTALTRNR